MPHDGVAQRALARAVGTHQGVHFAALDLQVHAAQDLLALGSGHVQIGDFQCLGHAVCQAVVLSVRLIGQLATLHLQVQPKPNS